MDGMYRFEEIAAFGVLFTAPDVPPGRVASEWVSKTINWKTTLRGHCKTRIDENARRHKWSLVPPAEFPLLGFNRLIFRKCILIVHRQNPNNFFMGGNRGT